MNYISIDSSSIELSIVDAKSQKNSTSVKEANGGGGLHV